MAMNRRDFVGRGAALVAGGGLAVPGLLVGKATGQDPVIPTSSEPPVRLGVVGLNGRGGSLMNAFHNLPEASIVGLCDVDSTVLDRRALEIEEKGATVATYRDFRRMIDSDEIDAVVIATPNHWHALMSVWAADAGKHVYVEKPVSHNVLEGRAIVSAAERNGICCQTGTQSRSSSAVRSAIDFARSGALGKITCVRGLCYKPRRSIGKVRGPGFVPETIDYHRWLGPAPYEPLNRGRLHYDWHWHDQTGNGDLGNQGVHQMDIARWGAGHDRLPDRAWSVGGRVGYDDDGNTPNTQVIVLEYEDGAPMVFEVRGLPRDLKQQTDKWDMDTHHGMSIGVILHCEQGEVRIPKGYSRGFALDLDGNELQKWEGGGNHQANFIEAVRADDPSLLNAPISEGHLSSACCHVGMVSHELGGQGTIDDARTAAVGEIEREAVVRMQGHMEANGLGDAPMTIGRRIAIDSAGESAPDPVVNARFTRTCRQPFVFPDHGS
ncbi:MAG: Gfo/Idh/MocA family oxidoreductase [Phycisphaerales bacterium]|nr:Gfo/Idh/MocA family oxidoreductase [Phycisphaerales bacterium]